MSEAQPGLALVNLCIEQIRATWAEIRKDVPNASDDLVCLLVEKPGGVVLKIGPRADYYDFLKSRGPLDATLHALSEPAADADHLPRYMVLWVVVPVQGSGLAVMKIFDSSRLSKGGSS